MVSRFSDRCPQRLSARGLLDQVPPYVPGSTDEAAFTQAVGKLCGPSAQGAFQSKYGYHAISPDWLLSHRLPSTPEQLDVISCLLDVMRVAGFEVGIIGNEAYAPTK